MQLSDSFKLHCFVFLGAFLLFTMEPMVARIVLPIYGGSFHVWTTTLTFFQGILFFGYLYCHYFAKRLGGWHIALVAVPLIWLPLSNHLGFNPPGDRNPAWFLLLQLTIHVALPFGVLATTSVIAQSWFTRSNIQQKSPYSLYASSNAGSILALLAYIALFEPLFGLRVQQNLWFVVYIVYVFLAWFCWKKVTQKSENTDSTSLRSTGIKTGTIIKWIFLSALPSGFMMAVSNAVTLELGSVPLVWVLPLVLYLLSYVFTFSQKKIIPLTFLHAFWPGAATFGLCSFYTPSLGELWELAAHLIALFFIAMVGHGELYRLRPSSNQLTVFYLAIALGGWLGGLAVSLIAPAAFNSLTEYPIIIGVFTMTLLVIKGKFLLHSFRIRPYLSTLGALAIALPLFQITQKTKRKDGKIVPISDSKSIYQHRNYYGIYKVADVPLNPKDIFPQWSEKDPHFNEKGPILRTLWHGSTVHGTQIIHPYTQKYPLSYYHSEGPLKYLLNKNKKKRNVAIIGLGVGACSTYFEESEKITFYELDPSIVDIAENLFTYLSDCSASITNVEGDARIQLEQAPDNSYDIIIIDAFSSDAIPTHLLTKEAFSLYDRKLTSQGKLIFHITNRHYDLQGVIKSTSAEQWEALVKHSDKQLKPFEDHSLYCVLLRKGSDITSLLAANWRSLNSYRYKCEPWTDDYINTLKPLYIMLREKNIF